MSILPGARRSLVSEERAFNCEYEGCNEHAAGKIAGEVDSMGVEWEYYCAAHLAIRTDEIRNTDIEGNCDECGTHSECLKPFRDPDEGMNGMLHELCKDCIEKAHQRFEEELPDDELDDDDDDEWPIDDEGAADDLDPDFDLFDTDR